MNKSNSVIVWLGCWPLAIILYEQIKTQLKVATAVKVAPRTPERVEIISGLKENESIVIGDENLAKPVQRSISKHRQIIAEVVQNTGSSG